MPARKVPAYGWTTKTVPRFGGGLNFASNPLALSDDEWTNCSGWWARRGVAEVATGFDLTPLVTLGIAGTDQIVGLCQNPFTGDGAVVAVFVLATSTSRLFTVTGAGVATEILPTIAAVGARPAPATFAFLNNLLLVNFGWNGTAGQTNSMLAWSGGGTYVAVQPALAQLTFDQIASFKSHVIGAPATIADGTAITPGLLRKFAWSASNDATVWAPSLANDADNAFLDDVPDEITFIAPLSTEVFGLFTRSGIQGLIPTGSIPAFTRQQLFRGIGCVMISPTVGNPLRQRYAGLSPLGPVFYAGDDLYLATASNVQPIGTKIIDYWADKIFQPTVVQPTTLPFLWHELKRLLVVPRATQNVADGEFLYFEPESGAWSKAHLPTAGVTTSFKAHAFIQDAGPTGTSQQRRHWIANRATIYVEDPSGTIATGVGSSVETKDFTFGDPVTTSWIKRIKVDWEPLEGGGSGDQLQIDAYSRDALLPPAVLGKRTWETPTSYVTQGAAGAGTELNVRLTGKYHRFRFTNLGGPARIRGFSIEGKPVGFRRTP